MKEVRIKKLVLLLMVLSLVLAGVANASVWNPAQNGIFPPDVGLWSDGGNWTPNGVPGSADVAVFDGTGTADCLVVGTQPDFDMLVMGDGGPGGLIRVQNTGSLTATATISGWSGVGYNNTAHMIVEAGGTVNFGGHLWVTMNDGGSGRLIINGGTVNVADAFDLGRNTDAAGTCNLNAGILKARYLPSSTFSAASLMDIKFGTFILEGINATQDTRIASRIAAGTIVAFGGASTVNVDHIDGDTYVTAVMPVCISPPTMDTNDDCRIDIIDFAVFALEWLTCGLDIQLACW